MSVIVPADWLDSKSNKEILERIVRGHESVQCVKKRQSSVAGHGFRHGRLIQYMIARKWGKGDQGCNPHPS